MIIVELIYNLSVLVALSVLSGFFDLRYKRKTTLAKVLQGILFGLTTIVGMMNPFILTEGIIFDGRSIVISLCTLFFGPLSGFIAALFAIVYRTMLGGSGLTMGLLVISSSYLIGVYFNNIKTKTSANVINNSRLYLFGLAVHTAMIIFILALPSKSVLVALKTIGFTVIGIYPLVTLLIGKILLSQEQNQIFTQQLKESEEKFRKAFDTNPDTINITRISDGMYVSINDGFKKLSGYTEEEVIGKTAYDLNIWHNMEDRNRLVKELQEKGIVNNLEAQFRMKDGRIIDGLMSASIIQLNDQPHILSITRDITERKKIEEKLIESEKNYHQIIEGMKDSVYVINLDGKIVDVNKAAIDMLGYSKEEFTNLTPNDIDDSLSDKQIKNLLERMPQDKLQSFQTTHVSKSKKRIPVEITSTLIKYKGQDCILSIAKDISQWIKAQESIYKSESLLNETQRLAKVGGWEYDIENNKMYWTDECFKIHGLNPSEAMHSPEYFISKSIECYNEEDKPIVRLTFNKCVQEGTPYDMEFEFTSFKNEKLWIRTIAEPVFENNKVIRVIGNIIDITERKLAEEALRQSESKFYSLFENSPNAIFISDPETYTIIDCNQNACRMNGYSKDELIGQNLAILHPEEINSEFVNPETKKINLNILKERKSITVESTHKRKDGSTFPIESSISIITLNGKEVTMGIDRDISTRKAIEKELETHRNNLEEIVKLRTKEIDRINKELISEIEKKNQAEILLKQSLDKEKELNQLKSRFISTASHEFRTPLTTILSSAELIQRYGKNWDEEKYTDHLNRITNSVEYLTNLMDDVLTISKIESGRINFVPSEVDLKELCNKVIEDMKITDNERHQLLFKFLSKKTIFFLDPKQMNMIIQNLLSNAFKYSDSGDKIELTIQANEETLQIKVSDNGYGISENDLPHLFEPFYRSLNTESIQGTGLGLAIVKNAVEMHGGTIVVNSKLGNGATFLINIPIVKNEKNSDS